LGFQIVDDILDVEGEAAALGKSTGKDAAAGKPTYPLSTAWTPHVAWPPNVSNAPTRRFGPPASMMNG
jgi:geranylgeranyl pyrophosphate synthase